MSSPLSQHLAENYHAPWRSVFLLAMVFALRMMGLFAVLTSLSLHARTLTENPLLIGVVLGIHGLAQALCQIPFGLASDRVGRKPIILLGLLLFTLGSALAVFSTSLTALIVARALQGAGAVSSAVTAMIADVVQESERSKAMAVFGISIALSFALALGFGPALVGSYGMQSVFVFCLVIGLLGTVLMLFAIPEHKVKVEQLTTTLNPLALWQMYGSIFLLHAWMSMVFYLMPIALVDVAGITLAQHSWVYLPVLSCTLLLALAVIHITEKKQKIKPTFITAWVCIAMALIWMGSAWQYTFSLIGALALFFLGFNYLEPTIPSLVVKLAKFSRRGLALGIYNTAMTLGIFVGALLCGSLVQWLGYQTALVVAGLCTVVWLIMLLPLQLTANKPTVTSRSELWHP